MDLLVLVSLCLVGTYMCVYVQCYDIVVLVISEDFISFHCYIACYLLWYYWTINIVVLVCWNWAQGRHKASPIDPAPWTSKLSS